MTFDQAGRSKADYDLNSGFSLTEARESAIQAEQFVTTVKGLLNRPPP
jgi:uncharacterized protein (UPF0332 family)